MHIYADKLDRHNQKIEIQTIGQTRNQ